MIQTNKIKGPVHSSMDDVFTVSQCFSKEYIKETPASVFHKSLNA